MSPSMEEKYVDVKEVLDGQRKPGNPPSETTPTGDAFESFPKFGELPPEIQILVWKWALANCFEAEIKSFPVCTPQRASGVGRNVVSYQNRTVYEIVGWKWMNLMLACKMSKKVVEKEEYLEKKFRMVGLFEER